MKNPVTADHVTGFCFRLENTSVCERVCLIIVRIVCTGVVKIFVAYRASEGFVVAGFLETLETEGHSGI